MDQELFNLLNKLLISEETTLGYTQDLKNKIAYIVTNYNLVAKEQPKVEALPDPEVLEPST